MIRKLPLAVSFLALLVLAAAPAAAQVDPACVSSIASPSVSAEPDGIALLLPGIVLVDKHPQIVPSDAAQPHPNTMCPSEINCGTTFCLNCGGFSNCHKGIRGCADSNTGLNACDLPGGEVMQCEGTQTIWTRTCDCSCCSGSPTNCPADVKIVCR